MRSSATDVTFPSMIDDWKQVWRETVDNFRRELHGGGAAGEHAARMEAMRRDLATARAEVRRLEADIARARTKLAREREEELACRRRADAARRIGDDETTRIAVEYEERHRERRIVLERKVDAFEAEHALFVREIERMRRAVAAWRELDAGSAGGPTTDGVTGGQADDPFERMERRGREREAEQRLRELKRRMRGA